MQNLNLSTTDRVSRSLSEAADLIAPAGAADDATLAHLARIARERLEEARARLVEQDRDAAARLLIDAAALLDAFQRLATGPTRTAAVVAGLHAVDAAQALGTHEEQAQ